jgi:uncharacterized membrane protein YcjF (UPF0283 family)
LQQPGAASFRRNDWPSLEVSRLLRTDYQAWMNMTEWPFRSRLRKTLFMICVGIMLAAAVVGLISALIANDFSTSSIAALTVGLGALFIAAGIVLVELIHRKYHPESGLFSWSDVDNLRALAVRSATDAELREWARSLADRIAIVLPGRR